MNFMDDLQSTSPCQLNLNHNAQEGLTPLANLDLGTAPTPLCFSSFLPAKQAINFSDSFHPESPLIRLYPASFPLQETTEEDQEELPMDCPISLLPTADNYSFEGENQVSNELRTGSSSTQVSVSLTIPKNGDKIPEETSDLEEEDSISD